MPSCVEVLRAQPGSKAALTAGHRSSVIANQAVSRLRPLTTRWFVEDPLELEAEADRGAAGRLVQRVALPLEAAVAEVVEGMLGEQEDRLGRGGRALELWAEPDVPDLDHAVLGDDRQVGDDSQRLAVAWRG